MIRTPIDWCIWPENAVFAVAVDSAVLVPFAVAVPLVDSVVVAFVPLVDSVAVAFVPLVDSVAVAFVPLVDSVVVAFVQLVDSVAVAFVPLVVFIESVVLVPFVDSVVFVPFVEFIEPAVFVPFVGVVSTARVATADAIILRAPMNIANTESGIDVISGIGAPTVISRMSRLVDTTTVTIAPG